MSAASLVFQPLRFFVYKDSCFIWLSNSWSFFRKCLICDSLQETLSFCSLQEWIICSPPWSYGTSALITISYNSSHTPLWILVYLPFADFGTGFVITVILNKSYFGCASIAIINDIFVNVKVFVVLTSKRKSGWFSKHVSNNLKYDFSIPCMCVDIQIQLSTAIILGLIRCIITGNRTTNFLYTSLHELVNFEQFICLYFCVSRIIIF